MKSRRKAAFRGIWGSGVGDHILFKKLYNRNETSERKKYFS